MPDPRRTDMPEYTVTLTRHFEECWRVKARSADEAADKAKEEKGECEDRSETSIDIEDVTKEE
jgi:hypothetical protein